MKSVSGCLCGDEGWTGNKGDCFCFFLHGDDGALDKTLSTRYKCLLCVLFISLDELLLQVFNGCQIRRTALILSLGSEGLQLVTPIAPTATCYTDEILYACDAWTRLLGACRYEKT
jgi:hypothetical protein